MLPEPPDAPRRREPGRAWYEGKGYHRLVPWEEASAHARDLAARLEREGEPHDRPEMPAAALFRTDALKEEFGAVKLEHWPEGLVLWVGGEIAWCSWRDPWLWHKRKKA